MADSDDQQPLAEEGLDAKAVHERVAFSGVEKRGHVGLGSSKKTDRLYRNRTDALAVEELIEKRGLEVHLVKEARPRIDPSLRKA